MKTLKVLLKQHTPLIHFQHDQEGATLRASEVKPKLDRFIIENVFNNDYDSCKHFLIGYKASNKTIDIEKEKEENSLNKALEMKFKNQNFRALNYKLKIHGADIDKRVLLECSDSPKQKYNKKKQIREDVYETETFPLILSNMGGKNNKEELINFSFSEYLKLDFTFWDNNSVISGTDDLFNTIKGQIARFFANTNFGQRSNKGFGSFTVVKIDEEKLIWNHNDVLENDIQLMKYEVEQDGIKKIKTLFGVIDFYWKCLKSGVNCTKREVSKGYVIRTKDERYIKSFLWQFLNGQGYTWEKRKVKNDLKLGSVAARGDKTVVENPNPVFFARAHLGCPINGITYRIAQGKNSNSNNGRPKEETINVDIDITNDITIERIASPIIFKPVFNTIKENGIIKKVVYIYILYDKHIIEKLSNMPNADFKFTRKDNGVKTILPLFLKDDQGNKILLDYHKLIKQYHQSMSFKMVPRDFGWNNILGDKEVLFRRIVKQK